MGQGGPLEILLRTSGLPILGEDPVDLSLGGSETAVVSMARALSRRGHRVTVAGNVPERRVRDGVEYLPSLTLAAERRGRECDLHLAARIGPPPGDGLQARMHGMWFHDMPSPDYVRRLRPALARSSFCLFLSRFQLDAYESFLPGLERHSLLTRNGVDFDAVEEVLAEPGETPPGPRFVYASRAERGLATLLRDIWPEIKRRLPEAELRVSSYETPGSLLPQRVKDHYRLCDDLLRRTPGAARIGPLSRRQLWREMAASTAVLYPTDCPEISCMVALEAQALGVPIVTTGRFALVETVGCRDTLISAPWRSPDYTRSFVETALRLAGDPGFAAAARAEGRRHVRRETHGWDAIAEAWESFFENLFQDRLARRRNGVLRRLLRLSDVEAARRLVAGQPEPETVFAPADLAELQERILAKPAELAVEPPWIDFAPDALPPQLEHTFSNVFEILGPGAGEPARLLDVGCFGANLSLLLIKDHPGLLLTGIDGNPRALAAAAGKARELGLDGRARFLHLVDPHLAGDLPDGPAGLGPRSHDVVLLCEMLEFVADPAALLEWAEGRARLGVVGYALHGPWEVVSGERFQLHHLGESELRELMGGKHGLELRYVPCGSTPRGEPLGCWMFRYRIDPRNRPGLLDLDRKILRSPPLPSISATLLVKNEEANLRRAVESLEAIVDEIVIGDTGSTDMTLQVAESMGFRNGNGGGARRLVSLGFEDFARARNALARHAQGDYILWQDADEAMVQAPALRRLVDFNEYFDAFGIEQRNLILDLHIDSEYPLRCFRAQTVDGPLQWTGCIHETIEHRINEPPRRTLICPDVFVAHLGYLYNDLRMSKALQRNLPLFLKDRQENPGRRAGYILGIREYLFLARIEIKHAGGVTRKAYEYLNYGFEVWHRHVRPLPERYRRIGFEISRKILDILAKHDLPLRLTGAVPLRAELVLDVRAGGEPVPEGDRPRSWTFFADLAELREELDRRLDRHDPGFRADPPPFDLDSSPELRSWSLPPELFGLEPFEVVNPYFERGTSKV